MAIDKAFMSLRVNYNEIRDKDDFRRFKDLLERYPGTVEEIALFHSNTHTPLKLEIVRERASVMKERMSELREMGYKAGINVLTTIGHHEENLPNSFTENVTHITDIIGGITLGAICPNDPRAREYVRKLYEAIASAEPEFIWIDDDIRFWHWPNGVGCFCDRCLSIFEEETGVSYTRGSLQQAFETGTEESKLKTRKQWLSHNRSTMAGLLALVEETVHGIDPGIILGQMTGDRFMEGYDFDNWAKILSGKDDMEVLWRPGGGFYVEKDPREMVLKSFYISRQTAPLPGCVKSVQSEIERIPSNQFGKSVRMMTMETALYIAAGATGAAVNSFMDSNESISVESTYPLFEKMKEMRPFYDLLASTMGRSRTIGVFDLWNKDSLAVRNVRHGGWTGKGKAGFICDSRDFFETGIPATYHREDPCVTLLAEDSILACSHDEILDILSGGVYMDPAALERLDMMGYGEYTGFKVREYREVDSIEKFTDHFLNKGLVNKMRDARQGFLDSLVPAALLEPQYDKAVPIASVVDYTPEDIHPCCMGIFENKLGGRICVAGYYPWTRLHYEIKLQQLRAVVRWLSKDSLPAYIASNHRINLWVRDTGRGSIAIGLINSNFDDALDLTLKIRTEAEKICVYDTSCRKTEIASSGSDGEYMEFVVPIIGQWDMRMITADAF